ncbi:hypothetical protein [Sansalvadorimonas verongulae]|uniref:hypothetical protein n=1 Tax=Sansalvadorimonas verongulae TaxID=2172824 RepID=UPI0012BC74BC|nr:hypothetical protein [Sansalvadorimonas verongulae]
MLFNLALRLGKTITELEHTMPCSEYTEWLAFFGLDENGNDPDDPTVQIANMRNVLE